MPMIQRKFKQQSKTELVSIGKLVPKDHLLRKIDKAIDFSFIYEFVFPLVLLLLRKRSINSIHM